MVKKKCRYWTTITQTVQGYPRIWPGVNGLAKPRFMQLKRPFWGVLIYQNNFPGQALNVCLKLWFYGLIWDILGPSKCILWVSRRFVRMDVLSGRRFFRTTLDVSLGRTCLRHFVRKTFCQDRLRRFVMKTFCQDRLTGGHILGISWAYLWHISGISWAYLEHILGIS